MTETESITVAEVSEGPCGRGRPGRPVDLPVVELLTGRGFVTGKSGSGKSNTASVVAEKLLDSGFGLLIVDVDGEYYGLKEEYEVLHAGADEECDVQVTADHAEKLASLALEGNVPVILDVSSFLDEDEASDLLTAVAKHLFAKAKKRKQPFLVLVEECHEYIPQNGSVGECGKMLIKISKRGRKHGLGVVGISQRPADVKKDFITQCDWLVWHRLTWNNDTKVVRRVLDADYAGAVEDLDDGEAFLTTDWSGRTRRVQFRRKRTFDAGATPGLDDFERPELKSVSDDLVSELAAISEETAATEDRVAELREELDRKNSRIAELETELADARDMQRMAEQFTQALVEHVEGANPGRTERERTRARRQGTVAAGDRRANGAAQTTNGSADASSAASTAASVGDDRSNEDDRSDEADTSDDSFLASLASAESVADDDDSTGDDSTGDGLFGVGDASADGESGPVESVAGEPPTDAGRGVADGGRVTSAVTRGFAGVEENPLGDRATNAFGAGTSTALSADSENVAVFAGELAEDVASLDEGTRGMLRYYRDHGPGTPMDALFAAGGADDRTAAYARNRKLRIRGLIEHVGRGRYDYCVPDLLRERTESDRVRPLVAEVEDAFEPSLDDESA